MIEAATLNRSDGSTFEQFSVAAAADVPHPLGVSGAAPVLVLAPAMGMPASYYLRFLEAASEAGFNALTYEQQGHEVGGVPTSRSRDFGYDALGSDLEKVIAQARELFPEAPVVVLGHSLGGQISVATLGSNPNLCDALVLVASGTPHWRHYGAKILLVAAAFPLIAQVLGYFPGKRLKFAGREAKTLIAQWGKLAFTGRLPFGEAGLHRPALPVLTFSVATDWLAPPKTVQALAAKLSASTASHVEIEEPGIDHYKWARKPESVLPTITDWLRDYVLAAPRPDVP